MFYETPHGAHVGDVSMSLIATCELCGANPLDYLTEPDRHASAADSTPAARMPWNYRETLASLASLPDAASQPSLTPCGPGKPAAQEFCTAAGRTAGGTRVTTVFPYRPRR